MSNKNDLISVDYQSVWNEGTIETSAMFNIRTGEITNIEVSDEGADYEILEGQYIVSKDGNYHATVQEGFNDFDYYADPEVFFNLK